MQHEDYLLSKNINFLKIYRKKTDVNKAKEKRKIKQD